MSLMAARRGRSGTVTVRPGTCVHNCCLLSTKLYCPEAVAMHHGSLVRTYRSVAVDLCPPPASSEQLTASMTSSTSWAMGIARVVTSLHSCILPLDT